MPFKKDFTWGAAAASYQIEGAYRQDGKGLSVWDTFVRRPDAIWEANTGDITCDHYNRYEQDVALMKQIGLKGYRTSLSWARILPEGTGKVNQKGLDFYDKLVDQCLAAGVQPWLTLFHWDYPYTLYCRGGWLNPASSDWFAEYTDIVIRKLGDRVKNWMTLNEPQCFIGIGHHNGTHAPGLKLPFKEVLQAGHNALLAHGKAVRILRENTSEDAKIGYAPVGVIKIPATENEQDIQIARNATFDITDQNCWNTSWWTDPVFLGEYPAKGFEIYKDAVPDIGPDDLKIISEPVDFCGANIYNGREMTVDDQDHAIPAPRPDGYPLTAFGWPVTPASLYWGPKFLYERYKKPIVITENGMANIDWVALDGKVHDPQRIDFLQRYLRELKRAAENGVEIEGYFQWSLTDNFEWAQGYSKRFGLIYIDYPTQKRILKESAKWYSQIIQTNGENL